MASIDFDNLFNPRSVAVIGASADKSKVGYALIANLYNQKRKVFPVSLSEKQILGLPAYASIKEIPEPVDLAVIAVRAEVVPQVLLECGEKKIPAVIVISSGFGETGEEGKVREKRLAEIAREQNILLLGPNCLGVINPPAGLNASFAAGLPPAGNIAVLSQSGALGTSLIDLAIAEGIGFSKFISLGNEASLNEVEFLEYLADDPDTKAILIYLENLKNGPKFMELAKKITQEKPLVVLRAGTSVRGRLAARSHTGALTPPERVFQAACRQAGVITVDSIRELFNLAKLFQLDLRTPLQKLVVLTNGGGPSVITTDLIEHSRSLVICPLKEETQKALREVLPSMAALGNPVDIIGDALAARYEAALKILVTEPEADAIILEVTPQMMTEMEATAKLVSAYRHLKPIIPSFLGRPQAAPAHDYFRQNRLANFDFPSDAVEALDSLARNLPKPKFDWLIQEATPTTSNLRMLNFGEANSLLLGAGIKVAGILVTEKSHLALAVNGLPGPKAMKLISPDIVHKTETGAVRLNIQNLGEAEKVWEEMSSKNAGAKPDGVLVQTMVKGKEVIIGMKRDETFGPTVLFGMGGIFAEAFRDTVLGIAPVDLTEAKKMISHIKAYSILTGTRGEPSVNLDALAELMVKISQLALAHPEIQEIDLNPVMAGAEDATVVDARIMF